LRETVVEREFVACAGAAAESHSLSESE